MGKKRRKYNVQRDTVTVNINGGFDYGACFSSSSGCVCELKVCTNNGKINMNTEWHTYNPH